MSEKFLTIMAELLYLQSTQKKRGEDRPKFDSLDPEKKKPFVGLAGKFLDIVDKMNLQLVSKTDKTREEKIDMLLRDRIEGAVNEFFDQVTIWKPNLIPKGELVAKIYGVWKNL